MKTALVTLALFAFSALAHGADTKSLPRSTPEAQGVSSAAVHDFVRAAEEKISALHSFMLVRRGHVVAEG